MQHQPYIGGRVQIDMQIVSTSHAFCHVMGCTSPTVSFFDAACVGVGACACLGKLTQLLLVLFMFMLRPSVPH